METSGGNASCLRLELSVRPNFLAVVSTLWLERLSWQLNIRKINIEVNQKNFWVFLVLVNAVVLQLVSLLEDIPNLRETKSCGSWAGLAADIKVWDYRGREVLILSIDKRETSLNPLQCILKVLYSSSHSFGVTVHQLNKCLRSKSLPDTGLIWSEEKKANNVPNS